MNIKTISGGFWVPDDSHIGAWQIECQKLDHAPWLAELACEHIPEGGVVFDCGAFNGDHTITYSSAVGKNGIVIACEPGETAFKCLFHNVKLFEYQNVTPLNVGLSDRKGDMLEFNENENLGASTCKASEKGNIVTFTIDSIMKLSELKRLDCIKIDCEGFELKILNGAIEYINFFHPAIMLEMNSEALKAQDATYEDIFEFLALYGYTWKICQSECKATDIQWDLLALPIK